MFERKFFAKLWTEAINLGDKSRSVEIDICANCPQFKEPRFRAKMSTNTNRSQNALLQFNLYMCKVRTLMFPGMAILSVVLGQNLPCKMVVDGIYISLNFSNHDRDVGTSPRSDHDRTFHNSGALKSIVVQNPRSTDSEGLNDEMFDRGGRSSEEAN